MFYYSRFRIPLWPFLLASLLCHFWLCLAQWQGKSRCKALIAPPVSRQVLLVARSRPTPPQALPVVAPKKETPIPAKVVSLETPVATATEIASATAAHQEYIDSSIVAEIPVTTPLVARENHNNKARLITDYAAIRSSYLAEISRLLESHKQYPPVARRLRQEGTSRVRFKVHADGSLQELGIAKGSGFVALDKATSQLVQRLGRHRPIPEILAEREITLEVDVHYVLQ